MAWHLRQALGDVLWRSEAGLPLNDRRTPSEWVEDLAARFAALGIDPEASPVELAIGETARGPGPVQVSTFGLSAGRGTSRAGGWVITTVE